MIKNLTRTGNSVALVLDKQLLEAANLDPDDQVEVSTKGRVIVIAPVPSTRELDKRARGQELMHANGLLESAVATPEASFDGVYLHATRPEMAAAYCFTSRRTTGVSTATSASRLPRCSCSST